MINLLRARTLDTLPEGTHADGGNLYLKVRGERSRQWIFRYKTVGRVRELSLGPMKVVTLSEAREIAHNMRRALQRNEDPAAARLVKARQSGRTFQAYAERLIEQHTQTLREGRHREKFANSMRDYVYDSIGTKNASDITFEDVERILKQPVLDRSTGLITPFWTARHETASRVRRRIEAVLDYADRVEGLNRRNPASWKGNLEHAKLGRRPRTIHRASLPYNEAAGLMSALASEAKISALCLRFLVLTSARSAEARGATWDEMDFERQVWTVKASRTKMNRDWRVPLSNAAARLVSEIAAVNEGKSNLVFPNHRGEMLSDVALSKALRLIKPDTTVHGLRATFRTWGAERGCYREEVLERALGHIDGNAVRAAYQRSDFLEERRGLAEDWASFCMGARSGSALITSPDQGH